MLSENRTRRAYLFLIRYGIEFVMPVLFTYSKHCSYSAEHQPTCGNSQSIVFIFQKDSYTPYHHFPYTITSVSAPASSSSIMLPSSVLKGVHTKSGLYLKPISIINPKSFCRVLTKNKYSNYAFIQIMIIIWHFWYEK